MNNTQNTILVIDDNEINRKYLRSVLSNSEMQPIITSGGHEALNYLAEHKVDLILVDIQMPEMDGFEFYTIFKRDFDMNCPVLAITAFSGDNDKNDIIAFGFNDYIVKPVKPNVLIETIRHWILNFTTLEKTPYSEEVDHVDEEVFKELLNYTDNASLIELIEEFASETKSSLHALAILKRDKKHNEILSILHVIKGNAGSFGFTMLSTLASALETRIKEKNWEKADLELEYFLEYADTLLLNYKRLLNIK